MRTDVAPARYKKIILGRPWEVGTSTLKWVNISLCIKEILITKKTGKNTSISFSVYIRFSPCWIPLRLASALLTGAQMLAPPLHQTPPTFPRGVYTSPGAPHRHFKTANAVLRESSPYLWNLPKTCEIILNYNWGTSLVCSCSCRNFQRNINFYEYI